MIFFSLYNPHQCNPLLKKSVAACSNEYKEEPDHLWEYHVPFGMPTPQVLND